MTDHTELNALAPAVRRRVQWARHMIDVYGFVGRVHIEREFEVSQPTAYTDTLTLLALYPEVKMNKHTRTIIKQGA